MYNKVMRLFILVLISYSQLTFSLNGFEFTDCFKKAFDESIETVRDYGKRYPEDVRFEISRLCNEFPKESYQKIREAFSEKDPVTEKHIPFDSEDMLKAKVSELENFLLKKIPCYRSYTQRTSFVDDVVTSVSIQRNKYLINLALKKMINEKSPKNFNKTLGDFDLKYCKN